MLGLLALGELQVEGLRVGMESGAAVDMVQLIIIFSGYSYNL